LCDNGYSDVRRQKDFGAAPDFLDHLDRSAADGTKLRLDE
jgi:hypothetical protein